MRPNRLQALAASLLFGWGLQGQEAATPPAGGCPCCSELHQAFDFWVGEWKVWSPGGQLAGTNRIEKLEGGCVLQEHWVSTAGGTGTSLNFYNAATGLWEQLWVDSSGQVLKLAGTGQNGRMELLSEPFQDPEGHTRVHRITWTLEADGSVRQLWVLLEAGEVAQTLFDGRYRKAD